MLGTGQFFQSYSRLHRKLLWELLGRLFYRVEPFLLPSHSVQALRNHTKTKIRHPPKQLAQFDIPCTSAALIENNVYNYITKQRRFAPKHVHGYPIGTEHQLVSTTNTAVNNRNITKQELHIALYQLTTTPIPF